MRKKWFSMLLFVMLLGCTSSGSSEESAARENELAKLQEDKAMLEESKADLEQKLKELQLEPGEQFRMDLRETMNLSFKLIHAMEHKDYRYLESVAAPGVTFDKQNHKVSFPYGDKNTEQALLDSLDFHNLEFWGAWYPNPSDSDTFEVEFAHFWTENGGGHGTIYMSFVRRGGWLFNGFVTNA